MFITKLSALAAVVSFGLFAAGCAAEPTEETASDAAEVRTSTFIDVQEGSFKLYDAPRMQTTDACDVHTILTLEKGKSGPVATLRDVVTGVCFLYVEPNVRTYELSWEVNRCGVQTYSGETVVNGERQHIAITDNRPSLCNEANTTLLIVDEYDMTGVVTTRYTQD